MYEMTCPFLGPGAATLCNWGEKQQKCGLTFKKRPLGIKHDK
jgi:hypothetical protein